MIEVRSKSAFIYSYVLLGVIILTSLAIASTTTVYPKGCWGYAPAVVGKEEGALSILTVNVSNGSGRVYVGGPLLGSDFQGSMGGAAVAASIISGKPLSRYNFYYYLTDTGSNVTINAAGPSGSALASTLTLLRLENVNCTRHLAMTGMIGLAGEVFPVGGVKIKALAVKDFGLVTFLVPKGEGVKINGLKVREVSTIIEAARYFGLSTNALFKNKCDPPSYLTKTAIVFKSHYKELLKELENAMKLINSNSTRQLNGTINKYLKKAELAATNGNYYAAASYVFTALIRVYTAYYKEKLSSLNNSTASNLTQIAVHGIHGMNFTTTLSTDAKNFVNSTISSLEKFTSLKPQGCYSNLWALEACAAVYNREYKLSNYLNTLKTRINSNVTITDLAELLALAKARSISIKLWLQAVNDMAKDKVAPKIGNLRLLANEALDIGYEALKYVLGLLPIRGPMTLSLGDALDQMYYSMYNGNYAKVIGLASMIYEESASALHAFTNATIVSTLILPNIMKRDFCTSTPSFIAYNYYIYVKYLRKGDPQSAEALSYGPIFFAHLSEVNALSVK